MDPCSNVLALANGVGRASIKFYLFCQEVKRNNHTIGDLAGEIRALSRAVESIVSAIDNPNLHLQFDSISDNSGNDLWASVHGPLTDTNLTLGQFQLLIKNVLPEAENAPKAVLRNVKLNVKKGELESFRNRFHGHVSVLNVSLQMLNLRAAYMAPNTIVDRILPAINRLHALLDSIPPEMAEREKKLRVAAAKEMSSARTVSSQSDTCGSVLGQPQSAQTREQTLSWIQSPELGSSPHQKLSGNLRSSSFPLGSIFSPAPSEVTDHLTNLTSNRSASSSVSSLAEKGSDPDEDFQVELISTMFEEGTKLFDEKRYMEAQSHLQKGFEHAAKLPVKRKDVRLLKKVEMMLATCACYSPNLNEAETRLYAITEALPSEEGYSEEDVVRRCTAMHLLSAVLFRERDFAAAEKYCLKAITARRKVLGAQARAYFESLYLLHQIYLADGDEVRASACFRLIPEDVRPKLVKVADEYPVTPELLPSAFSPAVGPSSDSNMPTRSENAKQVSSIGFPSLPEPAIPLRQAPLSSANTSPLLNPVHPSQPLAEAGSSLEQTGRSSTFFSRTTRTPSVTSSVSSTASASETTGKKRASVRDFFRRKSNPKSPNKSPNITPHIDVAGRGASPPEDVTGMGPSPKLNVNSMQRVPSPHNRQPSESLGSFLLAKIEEETGVKPSPTEYPGLF